MSELANHNKLEDDYAKFRSKSMITQLKNHENENFKLSQ